jgi:hypothetical protein
MSKAASKSSKSKKSQPSSEQDLASQELNLPQKKNSANSQQN